MNAKFRENKPLVKIKIILLFTDVGKSCHSHKFLTWQICLLTPFAKIKFTRKFLNFQYIFLVNGLYLQVNLNVLYAIGESY